LILVALVSAGCLGYINEPAASPASPSSGAFPSGPGAADGSGGPSGSSPRVSGASASDRAPPETAIREATLPLDATGSSAPTPAPHTVVAVVDTGFNPYHADFRSNDTRVGYERVPGFPANATPLSLSLGLPYAEAVHADASVWASVKPGVLYTVPGTRFVGAISMGNLGQVASPSSSMLLDDVGHGTATTDAVVRNAPDVDLVLVQVGSGSLAEGVAWAAAQPWIDVISISWGDLGNVPTGLADPSLVTAMRAGYANGKEIVVAGGNDPTLATTGSSGPAFAVSVGGVYSESHGETWAASKGVDVVSDFAADLATRNSSTGRSMEYGTSFATPTVAGALGEAWFLLRAGGHEANPDQLRAAMNATAQYWSPAEYAADPQDAPWVAVPVAAPWVQMGWGYVNGSEAPAIAHAVLAPPPLSSTKANAAPFMAAELASRQALWH
jgi:hypothetical protein